MEPLGRQRRVPPEPRRAHALRADVRRLLGVGEQQHDVARQPRPRAAERVAEREQQRHRARVVVGARVDGAADHAEMVVMRDQHDPLGVRRRGPEHRADVRAVPNARAALAVHVRRLLERAVEERRQPRRAQALDDVGAGARVLVGPAQPSAHLRRREQADIALERVGDEGVADGCRGGIRRHGWRRGARKMIDEHVGQRRRERRSAGADGDERQPAGQRNAPHSACRVAAVIDGAATDDAGRSLEFHSR